MDAIAGLNIKPIPVKVKATEKSRTDMHQLISDIQLGQYTDPELTAGLAKYSYKDFVKHTEQLLEKIILFKETVYGKMDMRKLVLNFLGDIVEGETIYPGQAHYIDQCVVDQLFFGLGHIISMIQSLAAEFPQIEIYGVWGNHGRLGKKGVNHARSNFDYIFYKCIEQAFEYQENVNVYVSKSPLMMVRHGDYNFCLFHGDGVKSWGGIPYYGLDRMARNMSGLANMIIHYVLVGHFHRDAAISLPANGRLFANGCWPGGSLLSVTKMFEASIPRQTMYLFHDEEGIHSVNDLRLGKLPKLEVGEGGIYYPVDED
jgi:hypothetical protein